MNFVDDKAFFETMRKLTEIDLVVVVISISSFGLVNKPITLIIRDGILVEVIGDEMAEEFKEKLFALPIECRKIVELGQGLSKMQPTGLIGVDESIIDSCHFGFGDGFECGTHLDVVIKNPTISIA